jgi:hypothetical protein
MIMMSENRAMLFTLLHAAVIQGTEEPLVRTQYIQANHDHQKEGGEWFSPYTSHVRRGGRIQMVSTILLMVAAGFQPHIQQQGF